MPFNPAAALQGAVLQGPQAAMNLQAMQDMYRARRGRDMFADYLSAGMPAPTAMNPPPGMSGTDVTANANQDSGVTMPAGMGATPASAFTPPPPTGAAAATPVGADQTMQLVPPSLRAMVAGIKSQNPNASPSDILAAVEAASPYMSEEQQQEAAAMKMQFDYYKAGADQQDKDLGRKIQLGNLSERIRHDNMIAAYLANKPKTGSISLELQGYNKQRMAIGQKISHYQGILYNGIDPKTGQALTQEQRDAINQYIDQGTNYLNDINSRVDSTIAKAVGDGYISADMTMLSQDDGTDTGADNSGGTGDGGG